MKKSFPKKIYVFREEEGTENEFYYVCESVEELPNDAKLVAIYTLDQVRQLVVTKELK